MGDGLQNCPMLLCSRNGSTSGLAAVAAPTTNMLWSALTAAVTVECDGGGDDAVNDMAACGSDAVIPDDSGEDNTAECKDDTDTSDLAFAPVVLAASSTMRPDSKADGMRRAPARGVSADRGDDTENDVDPYIGEDLPNAARSNAWCRAAADCSDGANRDAALPL